MPTIKAGQITFSFDKGQLAWVKNRMKGLSPQQKDSATERGFMRLTLATEKELKERILRGEVLKVRSGRFRQSIGSILLKRGREWVGKVGSGVRQGSRGRVPYANIHETGGVIRPRPGNKTGFLWIPVRKGSGFAIEQGLSAPGELTAFSSNSVSFRRVRSVTIPARRYLTKTVQRIDRVAVGIMLKAIDDEVKKAV